MEEARLNPPDEEPGACMGSEAAAERVGAVTHMARRRKNRSHDTCDQQKTGMYALCVWHWPCEASNLARHTGSRRGGGTALGHTRRIRVRSLPASQAGQVVAAGNQENTDEAARTSWPLLHIPDRPICRPVLTFHRSVSQLVVLSPDHVCAYRWMPGHPARVTEKARSAGLRARVSSKEARVMRSGRAARQWSSGPPTQVASSSLITSGDKFSEGQRLSQRADAVGCLGHDASCHLTTARTRCCRSTPRRTPCRGQRCAAPPSTCVREFETSAQLMRCDHIVVGDASRRWAILRPRTT